MLLFLPTILFGQKIKIQNGSNTGDLKEISGKYCIVGASIGLENIVQIQTDTEIWVFVDFQTGKKMKFDTVVSVLNYMDSNGWEYVSVYVNTFNYFIFKRKENHL